VKQTISCLVWKLSPVGLSFFVFLFFSLSVSSQAGSSATNVSWTDITDLSLEELTSIPVYAASKRLQTIDEAPSFVTVVTQDEIRKYGYRTLSDVLKSVPGFYISNDRNYDYVGTRGFSRPGDYNTRILFLLNGMRLNDCVFDSGYTDRTFPVDIDLIDRVEIIRGPASSLYGTSAFFGVVNVITRKPVKPNETQISVESGSFWSSKGSLSYGYLFDNGAALQLSGSLYRDPGQELYFKEYDSLQTNNGKSRKEADEELSGNIYLNFLYKELSLQAGYSSRTKHIPTGAWGTIFSDPETKTRDELSFFDMKVEHVFSKNLNAMIKASYLDYGYDGWWAYENQTPGGFRNSIINKDVAIGRWWIGEANLTTEALERNKITIGTEYRLNARQFQYNGDEGSGNAFLRDDRDSVVWAPYAEDEIRLHSTLLLNAGIRYDNYETFGGKASPRIALLYHPLPDTCIKAVYGSAFRAPNAYELYYGIQNKQKGNVNLKPEDIETYEFIIEQKLGSSLAATITGYRYKVDRLISQQIDPADGLIVFNNVNAATVDGMDLALKGKIVNNIDWKASYSLCEAVDDSDNTRLSNSPRHMIKTGLSAPLFSPKLTGSMEAQYMSDRETLSGNRAGGFTVVNATLLSRKLFGFELALSVYNLFDKKYGNPGGEEHIEDVIFQDGRTFRIKATYIF